MQKCSTAGNHAAQDAGYPLQGCSGALADGRRGSFLANTGQLIAFEFV
jgi:hypothetical protein